MSEGSGKNLKCKSSPENSQDNLLVTCSTRTAHNTYCIRTCTVRKYEYVVKYTTLIAAFVSCFNLVRVMCLVLEMLGFYG